MKTIGIFEAKTTFPRLCQQVARSGQPVLVQRRGHPLVILSPAGKDVARDRDDIHTAWKKWEATAKKGKQEFPEVWKRRQDRGAHPLT